MYEFNIKDDAHNKVRQNYSNKGKNAPENHFMVAITGL